jgi:hypothetical protein
MQRCQGGLEWLIPARTSGCRPLKVSHLALPFVRKLDLHGSQIAWGSTGTERGQFCALIKPSGFPGLFLHPLPQVYSWTDIRRM